MVRFWTWPYLETDYDIYLGRLSLLWIRICLPSLFCRVQWNPHTTAIELELSGSNLGQTSSKVGQIPLCCWLRRREERCLLLLCALGRGQANHQLQDRKNLIMPQVSQYLQLGLPASRAVRTNACQVPDLLYFVTSAQGS